MSAQPSALAATLLFWALLAAVGIRLLRLPASQAIVAGLAAVLLHWGSESFHQLGHAQAARQTGYPMAGIRFWFLLGASVYPPDEPSLPAQVHIRRALGGPLASAVLTIFAGILAILLYPVGGIAWWLAAFFFLENLLVFTLGALLPLGFNDGSTLLYWWGKREKT